ncbi:MAG: 4-hydroxy-tetrahydrodipicolinate reductase, partial [Clostridia bacterium]|nr:4-hydroxy-tetrahydrodipicolinate reductase [Clostridia bacterium]
VVLATTGYTEEQIENIHALSKDVPVFFSANMSLGVNLLSALVEKAAAVLGDSFDIEIVEKHHNQKVDAPSGTALMLANAAKEGLSFEPEYVYERHSVRQKRDKKEIGISAVRAGSIVGEHDVIFGGQDEVITLSHLALSKDIFAHGAINAALFLVGKAPGLYSMKDMLD